MLAHDVCVPPLSLLWIRRDCLGERVFIWSCRMGFRVFDGKGRGVNNEGQCCDGVFLYWSLCHEYESFVFRLRFCWWRRILWLRRRFMVSLDL